MKANGKERTYYPLTKGERRIYSEVSQWGEKPFTIEDVASIYYRPPPKALRESQRKNLQRIMAHLCMKTAIAEELMTIRRVSPVGRGYEGTYSIVPKGAGEPGEKAPEKGKKKGGT